MLASRPANPDYNNLNRVDLNRFNADGGRCDGPQPGSGGLRPAGGTAAVRGAAAAGPGPAAPGPELPLRPDARPGADPADHQSG